MRNLIKYTIVLSGLILFAISGLKAQKIIDSDRGDFKKSGGSEFRDAWNALKTGDDLFELQNEGAFKKALDFYEKADNYNDDYPPLNYKLGVCYIANYEKEKALKSLNKAYEIDPMVAPDVLYLIGKIYHLKMDFDKAIEKYQKFLTEFPKTGDDDYDDMIIKKAQRRIEQCRNGKKMVNNPERILIENLGPAINSKYREYGPVITADESMLIYTSRRPTTTGGNKEEASFQFFEDLYVSYKDEKGRWTVAENMKDLNTAGHDASIGLSYDGQKLYTYKGNPDGNVLVSDKLGDKWTEPEEMHRRINSKYHETSASVSADGKYFYFVSNREKDDFGNESYGGKDIFYCKKTEKGKWGKVHNIGPQINTEYNDEGCFIHADGRTMYFSSEGHNSIGGYDIFKIVKDKEGNWGEPKNLGYPVNTPDQDIFFVMDGSGRYGYYSTIKESGYGNEDIYRIIFLGPEKLMVQGTEDNLMASLNSTISDMVVEKEVDVDKVRLTLLKGTVSDAISDEKLKANIEIVDNEKDEVISSTHSNSSTGKYMLSLPSGKNYGISVKADEYLFHSENFNIPESSGYQEVIKDIKLSKVGVGSKIVLKNIFFDYNKATLRKESHPELNRLYKLLTSYSSMRVEIGGHTDNKGSLKYNSKLSKERAKAVVDYLVNKGIDRSRLEYKGYAYLEPIATNKTDEGRQKNRRVEFKVLNID